MIQQFRPIGGNERTEVFAHGLTEELLTIFGSMSGAFFTVPKGGIEAPSTGYELTGTARDGDRIRVTARLVSIASGECLWSGKFDYGVDASFDAQEEIARSVIEATQIRLRDGEMAQIWSEPATNMAAWEEFQRGRILEAKVTRDSVAAACIRLRAAIKHDPDFLPARIALAFCLLDQIRLGWSVDPGAAIAQARALHSEVRARNPAHPYGRALAAFIECIEGHSRSAVSMMAEVIRDAPGCPELIAYYAVLLAYDGDLDGRLRWMNERSR